LTFSLLEVDRGSVVAPAGCGKTQLIANALADSESEKPILVLTHTNSGIAALRSRLTLANVPTRKYRVATIDGWALRLLHSFPVRGGMGPADLGAGHIDYRRVREKAANLLRQRHLDDIVIATYDRLIVDEYQDCSVRQHALLLEVARLLKTVVLGDEMQAVFGFGDDPLANWAQVIKDFPIVQELSTPWRWQNAGTEALGQWLLATRRQLQRGEPVDLRSAPKGTLRWIELNGRDYYARQRAAASLGAGTTDERVLIIGDSVNPPSQRRLASQVDGAVVVESVDLRDLTDFAQSFDREAHDAAQRLLGFAEKVMTNVGGADIIRRVGILGSGTQRKDATPVESAVLRFMAMRTYDSAADALVEISREAGVREHRPIVLRACLSALAMCSAERNTTFHEATIRMREENRVRGRPLPERAVGSTLLLKGLESEIVIITDAGKLNRKNLYVALTRGSKRIVVCSSSPVLNPAR
jgi:hypothetical protein